MMDNSEILINIVIGLVTGTLAGFISGYIIAQYCKKIEARVSWNMQLFNDKQNLVQFIYGVRDEIDLLIKDLKADKTYLQRMLNSSPKFISFTDIAKIKIEHKNFTQEAYEVLNELDDYLKIGIINIEKLKPFQNRLMRAQIHILKINTSFPIEVKAP